MRQRHRKSLVTLVRVGSEAVDVSGRGVTIHQHCLTGKEWSSESAVHQRRADHLLSDAIFFIAADVEELVMLYLAWLNCCGGRLAVEQVKPWGYLCLPSDQVKASGKEDFVMRCCLSRYAGARGPEEMQSDGFQMLAFLADQVAPEVVEKAARRGRRQRAARGQLWTQAQVRRIRSAVEEHEAAGERSPMSIAASLSTPPPCLQPGKSKVRPARRIADSLKVVTGLASCWRVSRNRRSSNSSPPTWRTTPALLRTGHAGPGVGSQSRIATTTSRATTSLRSIDQRYGACSSSPRSPRRSPP